MNCDLYGICGAHTAGCVRDPDEGCPFYRYFKKIFQPRWIPVSERLPEESIKVLVQSEDVYYNIGENSHGIIIGWRNGQYWSTYTVKGIELIKYPVAWMPLPKPYKAESEEK